MIHRQSSPFLLDHRYQKAGLRAKWLLDIQTFFFDIKRAAALAEELEISLNERPD
jgi:hypothetical protein